MKKYLTVDEAADIAHMHKKTILKKIKSREIKAYKPGKCWVIDEKDFDAFIKRHSAA